VEQEEVLKERQNPEVGFQVQALMREGKHIAKTETRRGPSERGLLTRDNGGEE
jgi:hypothetical protein